MPDESQIFELVEEVLDTDRTPEEVCADRPELLWEVRRQWQRVCRVDTQLDAIFPGSGSTSEQAATETRRLRLANDWPRIPGYEVDEVLGHGGMGLVYRARHLKLNRPVALKMLIFGACATPQERARFQREAEATAGLQHPNIVQVYDVGEHDGRPYFTMEIVQGGSLAEKLRGTPLPAREAAQMVAVLAGAIHAAHLAGIVHRDLKPSNILLTAEGTPKIADFGLARREESVTGQTLSGFPLGTPSYMSPEQAQGQSRKVGPAVDIYALGAILYELLTGRPPFRAESAAETMHQVISLDPAPPSRLNAKVPRDLETICLKCLLKAPKLRYATARELADDLGRHLRGEPIIARPVGLPERCVRWLRRHPAVAALVFCATMIFILTVVVAARERVAAAARREDRARQEGRIWQGVESALQQAAALQIQGRWPEARTVLEGAPSLKASAAPEGLRDRLQQARADVDMVLGLEEIRLRLSESTFNQETYSPERMYAEAFGNYGLDLTTLEAADVAARVRRSAIRETLVAFLYDWLYSASDANRDKLRAVLDIADKNEWRRAFREALAANNHEGLRALATVPEAAVQSPVILSGLAGKLLASDYREDALALLRQAQQRHPNDFWINYLLGHFWNPQRPEWAVGYLRAAVGVRPSSDQAYVMLGRALYNSGDSAGAIAAYRKAAALNSNSPIGKDMAMALAPTSGLAEALLAWEKAIERNPPNHDAWYGYAQLCLFLGEEQAYRRVRTRMLDRFETTNDWIVAERTSVACLLFPASENNELERAAELAHRAVGIDAQLPDHGKNPYVAFAEGLAEYRRGRYELAIPLLKETATRLPNRPSPRIVLAMAQFQSGSTKEARRSFAEAILSYSWYPSPGASQADHPAIWGNHVLRREAERMIVPNLRAFLQGTYEPQENDERLALLGVCQFERRSAAAARLYADAFAADPLLADQLMAGCIRRSQEPEHPADSIELFGAPCRYDAARCAALVGCGHGKDAETHSNADLIHWRNQAREWLEADLSTWAAKLRSNSYVERDLASQMLMQWQIEPDFEGLRESGALEKLTPMEHTAYRKLWSDVDDLIHSK